MYRGVYTRLGGIGAEGTGCALIVNIEIIGSYVYKIRAKTGQNNKK